LFSFTAPKVFPKNPSVDGSPNPGPTPTLNVGNSKVSPSDQTTEDTLVTTSPAEDNSLSKELSTPDDSELKVPCEEGAKEGEAISADVERQSNEALESPAPDSDEDGGSEDAHSPTSPAEDNSVSKEPSTPDDSELKVPCEEGAKEGEASSSNVEPLSNKALKSLAPDSGEDGIEITPASPPLHPNECGGGEVSPSLGPGQQQVHSLDVTTGLADVDKDSLDKSTV